MTWQFLVFGGGGPWVFTAQDGKSHLWGRGNINLQFGSFPYEGWVQGGNGKFAGVVGGQIKLDRPAFNPPGVCQRVDKFMFGPWDGAPDTSWPTDPPFHRVDEQLVVLGSSGWLVGYIQYAS